MTEQRDDRIRYRREVVLELAVYSFLFGLDIAGWHWALLVASPIFVRMAYLVLIRRARING